MMYLPYIFSLLRGIEVTSWKLCSAMIHSYVAQSSNMQTSKFAKVGAAVNLQRIKVQFTLLVMISYMHPIRLYDSHSFQPS